MRENAIVIPVSALRRVFVGLVVLILLLVVLVVARANLWRVGLSDLVAPGISSQLDKAGYQAVFLTGGQVFFGKAQLVGSDYLTLTDVFYLSPGDGQQQASQLIKRGRELHGPKEPMLIPIREVLFIENLRDDSEVVTAISKFKSGQLPVATPPAQPVATAAPTGTARPSSTR